MFVSISTLVSSESMISFFLLKDADLLDIESKHFEDLEFQQLEHESRLDEEKENLTQQLLREVAEYQRSIVSRKVKALTLASFVLCCWA